MPRLAFDEVTGWWSFPLSGEAEPIVWIGEVERGPFDPPPGPPYLPAELRALEALEADQAPDEPPAGHEDEGPHVGDDLRWQWFYAAEAAFRGEYEPLDLFEPLQYQQGEACAMPPDRSRQGLNIGGPNVPGSTHDPNAPPNNWQSDNAVDIWLYPGTVVRAIAAGTVSMRYGYGYSGDPSTRFGGNRLHVEHANGMISFYQHLERITIRRGAHVRKHQAVGRSGFGNCVPHLHLAVTPPHDPVRYAADAWKPGAAPNPPPPAHEPVEPPPRIPVRGPGQSWHNLMSAIGPDRRAQRRRLARARRALKDALG